MAGRPRDDPTPDEVLELMETNRCYVVADIVEKFDKDRGTIRERLEKLAADDRINRRKHANRTVTYRKPND